jgi:hypothetical protein
MMDRVRKVVIVLAIVAAVVAVDKLWLHLVRWQVIQGWIVSLAKLFG